MVEDTISTFHSISYGVILFFMEFRLYYHTIIKVDIWIHRKKEIVLNWKRSKIYILI